MTDLTPRRLVAVMCLAQVLAQIGAYAWPALLPTFMGAWHLDNSDAGWITGIFYAAYTLAVPFLVTLTDRVDPKRVYLFGVATTAAAHLAFVAVVDGFWSALIARALAGIGWAGTYMTGLKLLADRVSGTLMARAVAGHAAGVGVAGALSFVVADALARRWGWEAAFAVSGACAAAAFALIFTAAPWQPRRRAAPPGTPLIDFRPVIRNRPAMAYAVAYCVHTWEMNALRGWAVAFLGYVAAATAADPTWMTPAAITTVTALAGTAASVGGNEIAIKWGRARMVRVTMIAALLCGAVIGFIGAADYNLAAALVVLWGILIWLDSSTLTGGTTLHAAPERRGATLAVHSMLGYAGGFVGPLALGWALDVMGGMSRAGWGVAFASSAVAVLAGRVAFGYLIRSSKSERQDSGA